MCHCADGSRIWNDRFITTEEFAELLGKSVDTLERWRRRDKKLLPQAYIFGREIKYLWSEVLKWIDEHRE